MNDEQMEDNIAQGLAKCLRGAGLDHGRHVLVHSSLAPLIYRTGLFDLERIARAVHRAIRQVIGQDAEIAALAATWETARDGLDFQVETTPVSKDLGLLPEYIRRLPTAFRTDHPVFSMCFEGRGQWAARRGYRHRFAFGPSSPWASVVENDYKILFIGLHALKQMSLVHHVEQELGVPYCYNKLFGGKVWRGREELDGVYAYNVPYRRMGIEYNTMDTLKASIMADHGLVEDSYDGIPVMVLSAKKAYVHTTQLLMDDCYGLLLNSPCYLPTQPPIDTY